MFRLKSALFFVSVLFVLQAVHAQTREPEDSTELMNEIRKDKFDIYLPKVMRENDVDMWIHIIRPWATAPLAYELGSRSGVFIFTDRGDDRIERVVLQGSVVDPSAYDMVGERSRYMSQQNYEIMDYEIENPDKPLESELDLRFLGLGEFVAKRDPQRIAVNYSETLTLAEGSEVRPLTDGISHTDYVQLAKTLGEEYAKRIVSAEHVILDYLSRRTKKEIEYHSLMGIRARETLDKAFDSIVLGKTTLRDLIESGPANVFLREPDGTERHGGRDKVPHVLKGGDVFTVFMGAGDMRRIMDADTGAVGYVLREGETEPPPEIKKVWAEAMRVRKILAETIKAGVTARQALERCIVKLEEAGFYYNDRDQYNLDADPEKTQVHLDLHAMGKGMIAPRISPMGPRWHADLMMPLYHTFAFEYMIHMPVPKWGRGKHIYIAFHDGVMLTENGIEFPYPADQEMRIIKNRAGANAGSVIDNINLGTTNTKLNLMDGSKISDYDLRVSVKTNDNPGARAQSMTVTTPSGESFTVERDKPTRGIDSEYGIEVNRGFRVDGKQGVWSLSALANPEYERFGDGTYTIRVQHENGSEQIELWYGEPGSRDPLPFPKNDGFTGPDASQPMTNPVTFTWDVDPIAQNLSVYFAGEGKTRSDEFPATTTSFGPYDYSPGYLELELVINVERKGKIDGVDFTITKGTVYSGEGTVQQ